MQTFTPKYDGAAEYRYQNAAPGMGAGPQSRFHEVDEQILSTQDISSLQRDLQTTMKILQEKHGNKVEEWLKHIIKEYMTTQLSEYEEYLLFVMFPDIRQPVKIPSAFPVGTHISRSHFSAFSPAHSTTGNVGIHFRPTTDFANQCLEIIPLNNADQAVNAGADLNVSIGQDNTIAAAYQAWRIIASCIKVEYVGTHQNEKGVFVGGLQYTQSADTGLTEFPAGSQFFTFSQVEDHPMSISTLAKDGMKIMWFPKDSNDTNFYNPANGANVQNAIRTEINIYGSSLPLPAVEGKVVRCTVWRYVEGIPTNANADLLYATRAQNMQNADDKVINRIAQLTGQDRGFVMRSAARKEEQGFFDKAWDFAKNVGSGLYSVGSKLASVALPKLIDVGVKGLQTRYAGSAAYSPGNMIMGQL